MLYALVDVCCICIHNLLLHLHSHSWFTFLSTFTCMLHWHLCLCFKFVICICMYVHITCFNTSAYVHAYFHMYLCNNTSNKDLMCMHQTTFDHFWGNISHMYMCICIEYAGEKIGGKCSWHVRMTHLNSTTELCMNRLEN